MNLCFLWGRTATRSRISQRTTIQLGTTKEADALAVVVLLGSQDALVSDAF